MFSISARLNTDLTVFVTGLEPVCIAATVVNKHLPPLSNKQRLADIKWCAKEKRGEGAQGLSSIKCQK